MIKVVTSSVTSLITSSRSPFVMVDAASVRQKIKVVEIEKDTPENKEIAGYSFVEATGNFFEYQSGSYEELKNIKNLLNNQQSTEKTALKTRFSNIDYGEKYRLIDWDNSSKGSFRICAKNPDRKELIIYNDSQKDLFVSVSEDNNPKIIIYFDEERLLDELNFFYGYYSGSNPYTAFNYNMQSIKNVYSFHVFPQDPDKQYGYGKNYRISTASKKKYCLTIFLTPDFLPGNLNKYSDVDNSVYNFTTSYAGIAGSNVGAVHLPNTPLYANKPYDIYITLTSGTIDGTEYTKFEETIQIQFREESQTINGFDFQYISENPEDELNYRTVKAPEDYSYILYREDAIIITEEEATLSTFGYTLATTSSTEEITLRVTEVI